MSDSDVTDVSSLFSQQPSSTQEIHNPILPYALTVGLILVSAITIVVATCFLFDMPFGNGTLQLLLCSFLGAFCALPILISIWAALGSQTWIIRIPSAIAAEVFLLCVYLGTFSRLAPTAPPEIYWMIACMALAITVAAHVPLWILRIWKRMQIGHLSMKAWLAKESQFSISHLLIGTTVVAVMVSLMQWLISFGVLNEGSSRVPVGAFWMIVGFCGIFILVMGLLTMLSILVVFGPRKVKVWCVGILCIAILAIPFAVVPSLVVLSGMPTTMEAGFNVVFFSIANSTTLILVLGLYYALGFRLRRSLKAERT